MALNLRKPKINQKQRGGVSPNPRQRPQQIGVGQAKKALSRQQIQQQRIRRRRQQQRQQQQRQQQGGGHQTNNPAVNNAGNPAVASPPTPPPPSPFTQEQRRQADEMLVREQARINKALYDAALAYGNPDLIRQYAGAAGADPNVTDNPNSAIAQITKARDDAARDTEQGMNLRNTFFSGLHNRAQKEISDDAANQFSAALNQWLNSLAQLTEERNFALSEYGPEGRIYREALLKDIEDAPEAAPQPLGGGGGSNNSQTSLAQRWAKLTPAQRLNRFRNANKQQRENIWRSLNPAQVKALKKALGR